MKINRSLSEQTNNLGTATMYHCASQTYLSFQTEAFILAFCSGDKVKKLILKIWSSIIRSVF